MLSKEENAFILYWEQNRLRRKKVVRQFLLGIPAGLLIVVPIVINLMSGWYKRAAIEANSQDFNPMVLMVALLLIVGFTAIFWQRHKWDQYEQRYQELLNRRARDERSAVAASGPVPSAPYVSAAPPPTSAVAASDPEPAAANPTPGSSGATAANAASGPAPVAAVPAPSSPASDTPPPDSLPK